MSPGMFRELSWPPELHQKGAYLKNWRRSKNTPSEPYEPTKSSPNPQISCASVGFYDYCPLFIYIYICLQINYLTIFLFLHFSTLLLVALLLQDANCEERWQHASTLYPTYMSLEYNAYL